MSILVAQGRRKQNVSGTASRDVCVQLFLDGVSPQCTLRSDSAGTAGPAPSYIFRILKNIYNFLKTLMTYYLANKINTQIRVTAPMANVKPNLNTQCYTV